MPADGAIQGVGEPLDEGIRVEERMASLRGLPHGGATLWIAKELPDG